MIESEVCGLKFEDILSPLNYPNPAAVLTGPFPNCKLTKTEGVFGWDVLREAQLA